MGYAISLYVANTFNILDIFITLDSYHYILNGYLPLGVYRATRTTIYVAYTFCSTAKIIRTLAPRVPPLYLFHTSSASSIFLTFQTLSPLIFISWNRILQSTWQPKMIATSPTLPAVAYVGASSTQSTSTTTIHGRQRYFLNSFAIACWLTVDSQHPANALCAGNGLQVSFLNS